MTDRNGCDGWETLTQCESEACMMLWEEEENRTPTVEEALPDEAVAALEDEDELAELPGLKGLGEWEDVRLELAVSFDRAVSAVSKVNEALAAGDFETVRAEVALLLMAVGERETELAGRLEVAA